jgi:hypothetical protein
MTTLTMKTRDRIRQLQDTILDLAARTGHDDGMRISCDVPDVRLRDLRTCIFPQHERTLRDLLRILRGVDEDYDRGRDSYTGRPLVRPGR